MTETGWVEPVVPPPVREVGTVTATAELSVAWPDNAAPGDLAVLSLAIDHARVRLQDPFGWQLVGQAPDGHPVTYGVWARTITDDDDLTVPIVLDIPAAAALIAAESPDYQVSVAVWRGLKVMAFESDAFSAIPTETECAPVFDGERP